MSPAGRTDRIRRGSTTWLQSGVIAVAAWASPSAHHAFSVSTERSSSSPTDHAWLVEQVGLFVVADQLDPPLGVRAAQEPVHQGDHPSGVRATVDQVTGLHDDQPVGDGGGGEVDPVGAQSPAKGIKVTGNITDQQRPHSTRCGYSGTPHRAFGLEAASRDWRCRDPLSDPLLDVVLPVGMAVRVVHGRPPSLGHSVRVGVGPNPVAKSSCPPARAGPTSAGQPRPARRWEQDGSARPRGRSGARGPVPGSQRGWPRRWPSVDIPMKSTYQPACRATCPQNMRWVLPLPSRNGWM